MEAIKTEVEEPGSVAKRFQCTICPKSFAHKKSLREHILNQHVQDIEYKCSECFRTKQVTKYFATQKTLNIHRKSVHGPPRFKCQVCFKTFSNLSNLVVHKKNHSQTLKTIKCDRCKKAFSGMIGLRKHLFSAHKLKEEDGKYFKCDLCSREFFNTSALEEHVIRKHVVDKSLECSVCSKPFIDQEALDRHMKRHDRVVKHFCDVCSKGFKHKNSLVYHLRVEHKKLSYCEKCSTSFTNENDFDKHISDSKKQEFKCGICEQILNSECFLKIHSNSHVKEIKIENQAKPKKTCNKLLQVEATKIECELCSKTFDREAYLTAHRNQVHRNAEWKCDFEQCSKIYKHYSRLRRHKMTHAETKEFVCNICQKTFHDPHNLKVHKRRHVREKKNQCTMCPKSFNEPCSLRIHIAVNHGGPKPCKCPIINCEKSCATVGRLNRHLVSHETFKSFKCEMCATFKAFKSLNQLKLHQSTYHFNPNPKKVQARPSK